MENPFKKIALPPQEVPTELKQKVMSDVARIKLFEDLTNLFVSNYPSAAKAFFEKNRNKKDN
jgi:aspartyl/asparaginyl-tRNA synthetase